MFGAAWYRLGCYRFLKKPKSQKSPSLLAKQYGAEWEASLPDKIKEWQREAETNPLLFRSNNVVDRNGPDADTEEQPSDGRGGHQFGDLD
jgi:hypothetical protein